MSLLVRIVFGDWYNFVIKLSILIILAGIDKFSHFHYILLIKNIQ